MYHNDLCHFCVWAQSMESSFQHLQSTFGVLYHLSVWATLQWWSPIILSILMPICPTLYCFSIYLVMHVSWLVFSFPWFLFVPVLLFVPVFLFIPCGSFIPAVPFIPVIIVTLLTTLKPGFSIVLMKACHFPHKLINMADLMIFRSNANSFKV